MPSSGKLSFPRMFCLCPPIMKNGISSLIHPLDCVLTIIFPKILIVSLVNPQYNSFILFSTGCTLRFGYLSLISCNTFCFKKLTGLAESTGMLTFTIISQPMPKFRSFFVSRPFLSYIFLTLNTEKSSSSLCMYSSYAFITLHNSWSSAHEFSGGAYVQFLVFT